MRRKFKNNIGILPVFLRDGCELIVLHNIVVALKGLKFSRMVSDFNFAANLRERNLFDIVQLLVHDSTIIEKLGNLKCIPGKFRVGLR